MPFISWPYKEGGEPIEVHKTTDRFTLEVDLMVQNPLMAADSWLTAGADMLVFHTETIGFGSLYQICGVYQNFDWYLREQ